MAKTIDMQLMRYINLFGRISKISTTDCFVYNNTLYFAVPKSLMAQALGKNAENVKQLSMTLRKKIRIIPKPKNVVFSDENSSLTDKTSALKEFVKDVVFPIEFTNFEYSPIDKNVTISGSREQKAILIGRDRSRQKELQEILDRTFGIKEIRFA